MNRQQRPMQKPRWNRGSADQHASVSRKQSSEDRRTKNEDARGDAQELIDYASGDLLRVQFERDHTQHGPRADCAKNPGAPRHGRSMFNNAQHEEEEVRAATIHDETK